VAGDFFESLLKRKAGVKDSGNIMPGHGGAMDRFDSFIFAVPLTYIYIIKLLL
jgi:phosphatidate cytidylyltransferase